MCACFVRGWAVRRHIDVARANGWSAGTVSAANIDYHQAERNAVTRGTNHEESIQPVRRKGDRVGDVVAPIMGTLAFSLAAGTITASALLGGPTTGTEHAYRRWIVEDEQVIE